MARGSNKTKGKRYKALRSHHFSPYEARELSVLARSDPVLRVMVQDRDRKWKRFTELADRKVSSGHWRRSEVMDRWHSSLSHWYSGRGWRVKYGPVGDQPPRGVGLINVWAAYRSYEEIVPHPKSVSPWRTQPHRRGKPTLSRDMIAIQKAERSGGVSQTQLRLWIAEKSNAIRRARGGHRTQLIVERSRLEKLLE